MLCYGSKALLLYFERDIEFVTVVININEQRRDNETTTLYSKARDLMQQKANLLNKKVLYELITENYKMIAWAKTKGEEIFHWKKNIELKTEKGNAQVFSTEIKPEKD